MTNLRDARFQRALDAAPDAGLRPDQRVRASIREAARAAVEQDKPAAHWKKWWNFTGSASPAWNAAFASVALATVVTLLWRDGEIPDAGVTSPSADKQAPAPMRTASVAQPAAATPPAAPVVTEAQVVKKIAPPAPASPLAPERDRKDAAKDVPLKEDLAHPKAAAPQGAGMSSDSLRDNATPALAKSAPAAEPAATAEAVAQAPAPSLAPSLAPAPPPSPAPAVAAPRAMARSSTSGFQPPPGAIDDNWTQVWIQAGGRGVRIERSQADRLPQLLAAMARSPASAQPPDAAQPRLRIELTAAGVTDIVEVLALQVRWTRVRENQPRQVTLLAPDAAQLQALQAEAERLLAR